MILWHNEIKDEFSELLTQALISYIIYDKLSIQLGTRERKGIDKENNLKHFKTIMAKHLKRRDLIVRALWERNKHCATDIRITDAYQPFYIERYPTKAKKYLKDYFEQRRDFILLIISVNKLLKKEAWILIKKLDTSCSNI